jgi:Flp pilus assembly protein TadD
VVNEALALARKAVDLAPQHRVLRNTLGLAHYRAGDLKAALSEVNQSARLNKGSDCWDELLLAMIHWKLGDEKQARRCYDRAAAELTGRPLTPTQQLLQGEAAGLLGIEAAKKKSP